MRPARLKKTGSTRTSPISVILVNVIIFSVIVMLREDPLSPGILDMFFPLNMVSCVSSRKRVYILNRIPVMAPISAQILGGHFFGGAFLPQK
jgi:hypothetical protein